MVQSSLQKSLIFGQKTMESKSSLFNLEVLCRMDTLNGSTESTESVSLMHIFSLNWIKTDNWQRNGWTNTTTDVHMNLSITWHPMNGKWNNLKPKLLTNKLELKLDTYTVTKADQSFLVHRDSNVDIFPYNKLTSLTCCVKKMNWPF